MPISRSWWIGLFAGSVGTMLGSGSGLMTPWIQDAVFVASLFLVAISGYKLAVTSKPVTKYLEGRKSKQQDASFRKAWLEPCRAWDGFFPLASRFIAKFYELRDATNRPENWQVELEKRRQAALASVSKLHPEYKADAEAFLTRFAGAVEGSLADFSLAAAGFNNWLLDANVRHMSLKRRAGL